MLSKEKNMIGWHNSLNNDLTQINKGKGDYAGIFINSNASHMQIGDYGDHCYRVTFDSICELSDIEDYLENNPEFLINHPTFLANCNIDLHHFKDIVEYEEDTDSPFYKISSNKIDDIYFENQKLRALIAIELGFDAVEENDGILVVSGKIEYIGTRDSEAVELEIEENY